uniref:Uncharacterized protein n=1 Tax=Trichuris muris TaxID=70415 RepID=A0A5S6QY42_TRIMR
MIIGAQRAFPSERDSNIKAYVIVRCIALEFIFPVSRGQTGNRGADIIINAWCAGRDHILSLLAHTNQWCPSAARDTRATGLTEHRGTAAPKEVVRENPVVATPTEEEQIVQLERSRTVPRVDAAVALGDGGDSFFFTGPPASVRPAKGANFLPLDQDEIIGCMSPVVLMRGSAADAPGDRTDQIDDMDGQQLAAKVGPTNPGVRVAADRLPTV